MRGSHCQNCWFIKRTNTFDLNFEAFCSRSKRRQTEFLGILVEYCFDMALEACNMAQSSSMLLED